MPSNLYILHKPMVFDVAHLLHDVDVDTVVKVQYDPVIPNSHRQVATLVAHCNVQRIYNLLLTCEIGN